MTPRSLVSSTSSYFIFLLYIIYNIVWYQSAVCVRYRRWCTDITSHLLIFNVTCHLSVHLAKLSMPLWRLSISETSLMWQYIFASSANRYSLRLYSQESTRSFINIINKNGPSIEPCGIPLITFAQHENSPSTLTLCLRSDRKFLIYWIMLVYIL